MLGAGKLLQVFAMLACGVQFMLKVVHTHTLPSTARATMPAIMCTTSNILDQVEVNTKHQLHTMLCARPLKEAFAVVF